MSKDYILANLAKARKAKAEKKKKHPFRRTVIDHHDDGTHTITHQHDTDSRKDLGSAVPDLDAVHDSLEENLGEPNEGEEAMMAGDGQSQ